MARGINARLARPLVALATALPASFAAAPAHSQLGGADAPLQEVVVTARRFEEPLRDAPLTVAALDAATLSREGVRNVSALAALAPGLTVDSSGFPNDVRIAMRGVTSDRGRPSVAVLLDGVDLSSENLYVFGGGPAVTARLLDVERVEVVRGTQTVLQGRNAFAGAINYISRRPDAESRAAQLRLDAGSGDLRDVEGSLNLPLGPEGLAARMHVASHSFDGLWRNRVTGGELGGSRGLAGSASLTFDAGDAWSGWLRFAYADDESDPQAIAYVAPNARRPVPGATVGPPGGPATPCPPGVTTPPCGRPSLAGEIRATESQVQLSADPATGADFPGSEGEHRLATLELVRRGDAVRFTSVTAWMDHDQRQRFDGDFSNYPAASPTALSITNLSDQLYSQRQLSQELRLDGEQGPWRWMAGALGLDEAYGLVNYDQFYLRDPRSVLRFPSAAFPRGLAAGPVASAPYPLGVTRDTRHASVFGALHRTLGESWAVGLEARFSRDRIVYRQGGWTVQEATLARGIPACPAAQPGRTPSSCGIEGRIDSDEFTPRLIVEYRPFADLLTYFSAARGAKPAGFNVNEVTSYADQQYRPESLWSYELGFKGNDADQRLVADAALFFNRYTDQQIGTQRQTPGLLPTSAIVNAGRVDSYGLEATLRWRIHTAFAVDLGYAFTRATYEELVYGGSGGRVASDLLRAESGNLLGDFSGNTVARVPRHALRLALETGGALPGSASLRWNGTVAAQWRSRRYIDESNLAWMPAYGLVDLRAGLSGERWTVTAYVDNLLDDDRIQSAIRFIDLGTTENFAPQRDYLAFLPRPRTAGVRVTFDF
jgi:outer membrane receptor protein involved in Fe transport